jgi:CHAT domain-containing protein
VLASLWSIPDQSTSRLMPEFYRGLIVDRMSKAQALRRAQMALIADPATAHPYHWSAFVLIGNWL